MTTARSRKEQIEELLAADPDDSFLRYGLAMEYVSGGDHEEAVRIFRELIDRDPNYVPAYLMAGQSLARLGREDEAGEILRTGITVATRTGDAHAASEMSGLLATL
ncbi:MAG: tetratricopeptide repeat protein [Gemmataceae bacterium]